VINPHGLSGKMKVQINMRSGVQKWRGVHNVMP
jgi:hypothetical protein